MTQTATAPNTWTARGFTDDVTTCDHCGKVDLKGTVRMVALDADGNDDGEQYMGVVCAGRMTGRKAAEIRTEASRADRAHAEATRAAHRDWSDQHTTWSVATTTAAIGPIGRDVKPIDWMNYHHTNEYKAADAAWRATNPEPVRPW